MSIIIISSDAYEEGAAIAKKTADALGYGFVDRGLIPRVSEKYGLQPNKVEETLDNPSVTLFGIPQKQKKRFLAYVQEAVLSEMKKDNLVCQGLLAHLYVTGVSHSLKVRILSDTERYIKQVADKEGISEKKAGKRITQQRKQRRQWAIDMFRTDETDPSKYDLTISLAQIDPDDAVKIIVETISSRKFMPMTYSIMCIENLALAAEVRAALVENFPNIRVRAEGGKLIIETFGLKREKRKRIEKINELVSHIPGVDYFEVHFINDFFKQAAEGFR